MIDVKKREECCGCTACFNICPAHCITMEKDAEGFLYPVVQEEKCIRCGLCNKVCPMQSKKEREKEREQEETKGYAVYAKEETIRETSTSGGVFPLIAENVIKNGGAVLGCAFDSEFVVEHILVQNSLEIKKLQGAKYSQSDLKDSFIRIRELLNAGKGVLFSGTPCQIEGLKNFLRKSYENLFLIDVVCHGVPSPMVWENYKAFQEKTYASSIENISLRNKDFGWKDYRVKIGFRNGKTYISRHWDDTYMKTYIKGYISRPSCYQCQFRQWHRESDLTLGDFWGIEQVVPQWNDDKGISLVMVHTEKGKRMLESISDRIESKEVSKEVAVQKNPSIIMPGEIPENREKFWKILAQKGYSGAVNKYVLDSLREKAKNVIGRIKR